MKKLTRKEEEIMQILWQLDKAFIKDIVDAMPLPKPHYNTVSTMMKILEEKEFVTKEKFGNMLRYQPLLRKEDYKSDAVDDLLAKYFDNSYANMVTHFAQKEKLSANEIEEILSLINKKN